MTAGLALDDTAATRLAAVAAWDAPLVRRAVVTLTAVAARLAVWRSRLGDVTRALDDPACWTGPAAGRAVAALTELSSVAAVLDAALGESSIAFARLAVQTADAQELAEQALRTDVPDLVGPLFPSPADAALRSIAAAATAAEAAAEPLSALGNVDRSCYAAGFWDLAAAVGFVGPVAPPVVPAGEDPRGAAAWWAGLSLAGQLSAVRAAPAAVGALDGVPAWARDEANRLLLARTLGDPVTPPRTAFVAGVVSRRIAAEEASGRQVQLHLLDLAGDRVVLALGDLDTAEAVAVLVPGIGNSPGDDLGRLTGDAVDVGAAARAAGPATAVATAVWLGYRPPSPLAAPLRTAARRGGAALARALDGLTAARAVTGNPPVRTTVLAHSYGTVVVDEAADVPGRLAADAVVLLGSPGMEDDAASLEAAEVFDAAGDDDPISRLRWFGRSTEDEAYGSTGLPEDRSTGHSDYYDGHRPTLPAIGEVVAGSRTGN